MDITYELKQLRDSRGYSIRKLSELSGVSFAMNEEQVIELAEQSGIDLTDVIIEFERSNVKGQLGRPYPARIEDARI